ncbi:NADPH-dependent FMN reductase [Aquisediminimonas profunda]|uniref:NADPH-dependent FMN reductase n=1 Tax=Aquisediminimonas profunda TaxID=1550733 RepID=UPI001C627619|nr:NADPH-dependent FMN reductase [Aquisediminimonas profunda]
MSDFNILGISGSLRKASYNSASLRAAQSLSPGNTRISIADISAIPGYNDDVREQGFPQSAMRLAEQISAADAVLVSTPEYNYSIPGALKNAIDWVSKAPDQPFRHKSIAIMGASVGAIGTSRAQHDLRKVFVSLDAHVLNQPEIVIVAAHTRFDASGLLIDEATRKLISIQILALKEWALKLRH